MNIKLEIRNKLDKIIKLEEQKSNELALQVIKFYEENNALPVKTSENEWEKELAHFLNLYKKFNKIHTDRFEV
jgi:hypothetical protein